MKFLAHDGESFLLEFAPGEHALLLHLLKLYPLVPEAYHRLTKDEKLPRREENQQLLDDALNSQRAQNQKEILALISAPERFTEADGVSRGAFTRAELEWLLQVVNDVRVGCWIALGSPGPAAKKKIVSGTEAMRHAMFMEIGGGFEMFFLGIINGDVPLENAA
jgi:hypothetical protein